MRLLKEVLTELWSFVKYEFGIHRQIPKRKIQTFTPNTVREKQDLHTESKVLGLPAVEVGGDKDIDVAEVKKKNYSRNKVKVDTSVSVHGKEAFILYENIPCYLSPTFAVDTLLGTFEYATKVQVISNKGDWIHVRGSMLEGWVKHNHITYKETDVIPNFQLNSIYDADNSETLKLRKYIKDEFSSRLLRYPVINCEYVWYKMIRNGTNFTWPLVRPRTPGRWHKILNVEQSVFISKVPLTGGIAEFRDESKLGQLYYIDSVSPDNLVTLSGFKGDGSGEFIIFSLNSDDWLSLQATCIIKK